MSSCWNQISDTYWLLTVHFGVHIFELISLDSKMDKMKRKSCLSLKFRPWLYGTAACLLLLEKAAGSIGIANSLILIAGTWLEAENRLAGYAFSASTGDVLDWKQTQAPWTGLRPRNNWRLRVPSVELWIMKTWIADAGWTFWVTYKCHRKGLALRRDHLKLSCWLAFYLWSEANCILTCVPQEKLLVGGWHIIGTVTPPSAFDRSASGPSVGVCVGAGAGGCGMALFSSLDCCSLPQWADILTLPLHFSLIQTPEDVR